MFSRSESNTRSDMQRLDNQNHSSISLPPPASARAHQRSRTTIDLPPLFTRTASPSPTRSSAFMPAGKKSRDSSPSPWSSTSTLNNDPHISETQRKPKPGAVGKIASWFEGSSDPVNITFVPPPKKEQSEKSAQLDIIDEDIHHQNSTNMDNLTRRPPKQGAVHTSRPNSRFSFFKKTTLQESADPDELVRMDIREALIPDGPVDEVTFASFKNLQLNAESLLRRFQTSYAENLSALRQLTVEKGAQTDEFEAAQTRNEHLKFQLLEMAEKASEQEKVIASLKSQLAMPQPSVRMISDVDEDERPFSQRHGRRNRFSDISASDESFVDSETSSAVSIFSEVESIRTPSTSVAPSPTMKHARLCSPTVIRGLPIQAHVTPILTSQCQNCHNVPRAEAWDVIEMMKMESAGLKNRIAELESAHDSALTFLSALEL